MFRTCAAMFLIIGMLTGCAAPQSQEAPPTQQSAKAGAVTAEGDLGDIDTSLRDASSTARRITYASRSGVTDGRTRVTGLVFVPKGTPPEGGFPIVALGPETFGTASGCALSLSADLHGAATTVKTILEAGYIVAVPDYQGLGRPTGPDDGKTFYYPFLDSTTAGYNMIDAVRAARSLIPEASASWAALGVREGGQAAWAANELADNYGGKLTLVGTASVSPVLDFTGLLDHASSGTLTDDQKIMWVSYLAALGNEYPEVIDLDDYRRGAASQNWDALLDCQEATPGRRMELAARISADELRPANPAAVDTLRGYLQKTTLPQGPAQAPMLVIYSDQDSAIPHEWTDHALDGACTLRNVVSIRRSPGATDPAAITNALAWIGDRFASQSPPDDCSSFTARDGS